MKKKLNFCKTGRNVYEGIKEVVTKFFLDKQELTRDEIIEKLNHLKEEFGYNIFIFKTWENSSDFIRFVTKMDILSKKGNFFRLSQIGKKLGDILLSSEEEFKRELFKHIYIKSYTEALRFRNFCDYLKINMSSEGYISLEKFNYALTEILIIKQQTNYGTLHFLKSVDVLLEINKAKETVHLSVDRMLLIDRDIVIIKIIKENLDKNKQISYENAKELLSNFNIHKNVLDDLEFRKKIIIRITRSGKFIDFS